MFHHVKHRVIASVVTAIATVCTAAALAATTDSSFGTDRFLAGDDISLRQEVAGDVFAAGGRASLAAPVAGDAVITGGNLEVRSDVGEDLYAAGGSVRIEGRIGGNARVVGGSIDVHPRARIEGSASLAGGRIGMEGSVGRGLQAFGQRVVIDGTVAGDVEVAAQELIVGPHARVDGQLRYRGSGEPEIAAGSEIKGGVVRRDAIERRGTDGWSWDSGPARFFIGLGRFLWALGVFLLGSVLILLMPAFTLNTTSTVRAEPLASIGVGLAMLLAVPVAILLLFVTLVGIPLGLATMFGYALLLMLGYMTGALFIGDWTLGRFAPDRLESSGSRMLALFGALVLIAVARYVPLVGPLAILLLFLAGLGAWTRCAWRIFRPRAPALTA